MGLTFDQYLKTMELTADKFKEDNKKQAADMVRPGLGFGCLGSSLSTLLQLKTKYMQNSLQQTWMIQMLIEAEWRKEGRLPMIRESIVRANALRDVVAKAKATEVVEAKVEE